MEPMTAKEMYNALSRDLGLASHTISFHIVNDDPDYIDGGLVDCREDLYQSDAFDAFADDHSGAPSLCVSVYSFQIGNGESDNATREEIEILSRAMRDEPSAFESFLYDYADVLYTIDDYETVNPAYDPEEYDD